MRLTALLYTLLLITCPMRAFALDDSPLKLLSDAEKSYYELVFTYVMDTVKADGTYKWESYSGNGTFTVSDSYVSKSGATCRNFAEVFTVQGVGGENEGVGCKRAGREGWCKLRMSDALTCAMEPNRSKVKDRLRDAQDYLGGSEGSINGIRQMLP